MTARLSQEAKEMATLTAGRSKIRACPRVGIADPWAAHNASSHIPNERLQKVIEDADRGIGLFGTFATAEEAVRAMLEDFGSRGNR